MIQKIGLVLFGGLILSGCSLSSIGTPVVTNQVSPNGVPLANIQKGSIWKSADAGQSFAPQSKVDEKNQITAANVLALSFDPSNTKTLYAGTVDNGIFKTENGAETWTPIVFPPKKIYSFFVDRSRTQVMFASGVLGNHGKIYRTEDGGITWKDVYTEPGDNIVVTAIAQHPRDNNVIFAGTSGGTVVKSTDAGTTWHNVGNKVDGPVLDILFDAKLGFSVYLLVHDVKMYYSSDGGENWQDWETVKLAEEASSKLTSDQVKERQLRIAPTKMIALSTSPNASGVVYAANIGGLYKSTDFGKFWDKVNIIESASKFPIRSIALHPTDPHELSFVSGAVFYKTVDAGKNWLVPPLNIDRAVSVVTYDPLDSKNIYIALRKF